MKFTGYLALVAALAVAGSLAAPVSVDDTSLAARDASDSLVARSILSGSSSSSLQHPCTRTVDLSAILTKIESLLSEFGSEKGEVLKYLYWIRNVLGYKKKHLFTELESLLKQHGLADKDITLSRRTLPADVEGVLEQLGDEKQRAIRWFFWLRNTLGYKKHKLMNELESLVDEVASKFGADDVGKAFSSALNGANSVWEGVMLPLQRELGHILYPNKF